MDKSAKKAITAEKREARAMEKHSHYWIVPANPKIFRHTDCFILRGYIDWKQKAPYQPGDIVFIYSSAFDKKILFKTIVEAVNIPEAMVNDDEFWIDRSFDNRTYDILYCRLRFLVFSDTDSLSYCQLKREGLTTTLQRPLKIGGRLADYIERCFTVHAQNIVAGQFADYLRKQGLSAASVKKYSLYTPNYIQNLVSTDMYSLKSWDAVEKLQHDLQTNKTFQNDNENGNHMYSRALYYYQKYIESISRCSFEELVAHSFGENPEDRRKRLNKAPAQSKTVTVTQTVHTRNPDVVAERLYLAHGICQDCGCPAPFLRKSDGLPYLEVHHIVPLAKKGEDTVENTVALCPNCHRKRHYG